MRRVTIGSAIVLALLLTLTAIATAAPPDGFCDRDGNEDHWKCTTTTSSFPTTTSSTTTTTVPEPPTLEPCPSGTFHVEYSPGTTTFECDWILPNEAPEGVEDGGITVQLLEGKVQTFTVMVRDSSPGDICELSWDGKTARDWEWYQGQLTDDLELTVPLEEWTVGTYWDFVYTNNVGQEVESSGEHWCGPYDPIEGLRTDLNGDPLHLRLIMRATKGTVVKVILNPVLTQEEEGP